MNAFVILEIWMLGLILMKLILLMGILGDYFLMTQQKCTLCFFLHFGHLIRNLPSLFHGLNQRMINLICHHLHQLNLYFIKGQREQVMQKH
jgi:hypothetical protein